MKKLFTGLLVSVFMVSMVFIGTGCTEETIPEAEEVVEESAPAEEEVEEAAPAEEVVEEEVEEEVTAEDELDPWIEELWAEVDEFRHPIPAEFKGPNGETVTSDVDSLILTTAEVEEIRAMNIEVGLPWHSLLGEYFTAWQKGTHDACEYLNMEIVAETDAVFDPTKQMTDVESMIPLNPDVLIAAPADVTTGAAAFQPAVDAGILLSFISNIPLGYERGKDFIGVSTSNCHDIGVFACETSKELLGEGGKIGLIIWAQEYWFANYADNIVVDQIEEGYGLDVVDNQGFVTPDDAYNVATSMILNNPDIEGFYITYMVPALSVATACIDAERPDLKVVTGSYDLPTLLNMASGGNIAGITTDATYLVGVNSVIVAAYGMLGKDGPEYAVCPAIKMTLENMREIWELGMRIPLAEEVDEALKASGY